MKIPVTKKMTVALVKIAENITVTQVQSPKKINHINEDSKEKMTAAQVKLEKENTIPRLQNAKKIHSCT